LSVEIHIPQFLQHLSRDVKTVEGNGRTVGECLSDLVKQFPELEARLFDRNGELVKYLVVLVNGVSAYPEELVKPVNDRDKLHIINIIAGG